MRCMSENEGSETCEAWAPTSFGVAMQTMNAYQYRFYYGPFTVGMIYDNFGSGRSVYKNGSRYPNQEERFANGGPSILTQHMEISRISRSCRFRLGFNFYRKFLFGSV